MTLLSTRLERKLDFFVLLLLAFSFFSLFHNPEYAIAKSDIFQEANCYNSFPCDVNGTELAAD